MDGWMDGSLKCWHTKPWAPLTLMHIVNTWSMNLNFSDLWLLHLEIMLLSLARGWWVPTWALKKKREKKNTLPTLLHWLLARWLSGVSGLISKQTDLILMPCLQLFSPESFSAELLSWTDTHYMVLVFSRPLPSSIFLPFRPTAAAKIDVFFWGVRDCELVYIKQAEITIPLQQKKINSSNWLCLWKKNRMVSQALKQIDPYGR